MLTNAQCQAEARVNGVLRGGSYSLTNKTFTFHAGMVEITTDTFDDLNIFDPLGFYGKYDIHFTDEEIEKWQKNIRKIGEAL